MTNAKGEHDEARLIAGFDYATHNEFRTLARAYLDLLSKVEAYTDLHGCKHDRLRSEDEMFAVTKALVALRSCLQSPPVPPRPAQ